MCLKAGAMAVYKWADSFFLLIDQLILKIEI